MTWSMMSLVRLVSCPLHSGGMRLFLFIYLHSSFLVFLHIMISKRNAYIRLTLPLMVLLTREGMLPISG